MLAASSERWPLDDDAELGRDLISGRDPDPDPGRDPDPDPGLSVVTVMAEPRCSDRSGGRGMVHRPAAAVLRFGCARCGIRELIGKSSSADESSSDESVRRRAWLGATAEW